MTNHKLSHVKKTLSKINLIASAFVAASLQIDVVFVLN